VVGIVRDEPGPLLAPDQHRLLDALTDQAALAIERVNLARDLHQTRLQVETDRLRQALLTSISHDLRTPLASILGSASSLKSQSDILDEPTKQALLGTILEESERLNRFIGNLLDMTRLEAGALRPRSSLVVLSDVIGAALQRASKILATNRVSVALEPGLPMLDLDMVLFEQVLFNVLDNAAKYAPPGSLIQVRGHLENDLAPPIMAAAPVMAGEGPPSTPLLAGAADSPGWRPSPAMTGGAFVAKLEILDEGDGIPPGSEEQVFEKFYRVHDADRRRAGTGLGLAICRGFVEAMNGTITVANRADRSGLIVTIAFKVPVGAPLPEDTTA
jgi:two-component system sensor histidine kinase KdpD